MTTTVHPSAKAEILKADILINHPAPPKPALYFDAVMVRKDAATGMFEFVMKREGREVATVRADNRANLDAGDAIQLNRIAGYIGITIQA